MSTNNTVGNPTWEKGVSANPSGRPKGVPNKATIKIKDAYAELIANNLDRIQSLLDRVAVTDPKGALNNNELKVELVPDIEFPSIDSGFITWLLKADSDN